jgi:hypothetical protein
MEVLGLSALDELQARLEADPEGWTKRELMELAELLLIKQRLPGERREVSPGGVRVNVQFVTAESSRPPAKVIEHFGESPEGLDDRYHAAGHFAGAPPRPSHARCPSPSTRPFPEGAGHRFYLTRSKACFHDGCLANHGDCPEACGSSGGWPILVGRNSPKHYGHRPAPVTTPIRRCIPGEIRHYPIIAASRDLSTIRASWPVTDGRIVKSMAPSNARAGHSRLGRQAINSTSLTTTAGHPQVPSQAGLGIV